MNVSIYVHIGWAYGNWPDVTRSINASAAGRLFVENRILSRNNMM